MGIYDFWCVNVLIDFAAPNYMHKYIHLKSTLFGLDIHMCVVMIRNKLVETSNSSVRL